MKEKPWKKEEQATALIEGRRAYLLERAYHLTVGFDSAFYVQCVESTAADAYEVFLEARLDYNYFGERMAILGEGEMFRFYKLAGIHHTLRVLRRRKKDLQWEKMKESLFTVYDLDEGERQLAEILYHCIFLYQTGFQDLVIKTTARYIFGEKVLSAFSFAFIGNFWYNSYSSFMGSFTGYVPFHIRMQRAAGQ